MQPQPDRRSVISLSVLLIAAILFAIITLIFAPRFFAGEFRGSYHFWLIAARLIPWIGLAMLLPALIFFRAHRYLLTALMVILCAAFVILGDQGAMQYRGLWDAGSTRYYTVSDHLYLPPLDRMLEVYVIECDAHDLRCVSTPLATIPDSSWVEPAKDDSTLLICERAEPDNICRDAYDFPPGTAIPPIKPPD